jgi:iron complex outermembrane receptor protein
MRGHLRRFTSWLRRPSRRAQAGVRLLACLCLAQAASAEAAQAPSFDLPAQSLRSALFALATRADISIGLSGVDLTNLTSRPLSGAASIEDALSQLLTGTGLAFERIDPTTWRIFAPSVSTAARAPKPPTVPLTLPPLEEITVTASKRPLSLLYVVRTIWTACGLT